MKLKSIDRAILCFLGFGGIGKEARAAQLMDATRCWFLGSLYVSITRLETQELIKSRWSDDRYRRYRLYSITQKGTQAI